jgi:hypothetical protein
VNATGWSRDLAVTGVISDFRVMGDQRELLGPVASVSTAWRALKESATGPAPATTW